MKKAIVTTATGRFYEQLAEKTHPKIESYAKKVDADFIRLNKPVEPSAHWAKLELYKLLDEYDRVLWVDTDILIRDDAPDIFQIVPQEKIGLFNEAPFTDRENFKEFLYECGIDPKNWKGDYYNTGVMVCSKQHQFLFLEPEKKLQHFYEQSYLNLRLLQTRIPVHNLNYKFNRMCCMDKITGEDRYDSYFLHYAGISGMIGEENMLKCVTDDAHRWKVDHPTYKYKKKIVIPVQGGLGDQITAEPTVRFLAEQVHKEDDVCVITHWTEIFSHLKNITIIKAGEPIPPKYAGALKCYTLRDTSHISWRFMSHALINATDYASICALKMHLPEKDKPIKLSYTQENTDNLSSLGFFDIPNRVIVHPGKGWPTKTFSSDFWNMLLSTLIENGFKPIIVGKNMDRVQGVVDGVNFENCLNLINKLSNTDLFAAIQNCQALITNDSAPLHVAGSSDCYIGLIASCKRPEYILPYRKSPTGEISKFTKTVVLNNEEKSPYNFWNISPTTIDSVEMDKWEGDEKEYLPQKEKISEFCKLLR